MSTNTYFDRIAALEYLMSAHVNETREVADTMLTDEGFCQCCGVDFTGLDRDTLHYPYPQRPLDPHPWSPGVDGEAAEGKVDFDDDEGCTIATVRVTRIGNGYAVHITQLNDLDNLVIVHTNE